MPAKKRFVCKPWDAPPHAVASVDGVGGDQPHGNPRRASPARHATSLNAPDSWEQTQRTAVARPQAAATIELGDPATHTAAGKAAYPREPHAARSVAEIGGDAPPTAGKRRAPASVVGGDTSEGMAGVGSAADGFVSAKAARRPGPMGDVRTGARSVDELGSEEATAHLSTKKPAPALEGGTRAQRRERLEREHARAAWAGVGLPGMSRYLEDYTRKEYVPNKFDKEVPRPKDPPLPKHTFDATSSYQAVYEGTTEKVAAQSCKPVDDPDAAARAENPVTHCRLSERPFDAVSSAHDFQDPRGIKGLRQVRLGVSGREGVAWVGEATPADASKQPRLTSYGAETSYSADFREKQAVAAPRVVPVDQIRHTSGAEGPQRFAAASAYAASFKPQDAAACAAATAAGRVVRDPLQPSQHNILYGGEDHEGAARRSESRYARDFRAKTRGDVPQASRERPAKVTFADARGDDAAAVGAPAAEEGHVPQQRAAAPGGYTFGRARPRAAPAAASTVGTDGGRFDTFSAYASEYARKRGAPARSARPPSPEGGCTAARGADFGGSGEALPFTAASSYDVAYTGDAPAAEDRAVLVGPRPCFDGAPPPREAFESYSTYQEEYARRAGGGAAKLCRPAVDGNGDAGGAGDRFDAKSAYEVEYVAKAAERPPMAVPSDAPVEKRPFDGWSTYAEAHRRGQKVAAPPQRAYPAAEGRAFADDVQANGPRHSKPKDGGSQYLVGAAGLLRRKQHQQHHSVMATRPW